ncbi:MAG: hydroxymethylbilane synthase, partial [Candidatus Hydrogenedentes bacterium]|nr:hydroxymethylbilane synthase [Candidatus Hydrogenedentota bacterium]
MKHVIIGSRGSELALAQTHFIAGELRKLDAHIEVEVRVISSRGDTIQDVPLAKVGGKGIFTKELEVALLDGTIDLAVHSLKDLPTELPRGLCIGAIPPRENPRDVLVSRRYPSLAALPQKARVGTSSQRRQVQLLAYRPDLQILDIRGNVPTRVRKLEEGQFDAIVLAAAGLNRLGLSHLITEVLPPQVMLPAVGQGALAVELREDNTWLRELLAQLNDTATAAAVTAERALLQGLGGGCQTPLGALAEVRDGGLSLTAIICGPAGGEALRVYLERPMEQAAEAGREAAAQLLDMGAHLVDATSPPRLPRSGEDAASTHPLAGRRVTVTRAMTQVSGLAQQLETLGADVFAFPTIEVRSVDVSGPIPPPDAVNWIIFTSANAVQYFQEALAATSVKLESYHRCSICAIGPATAEAVLRRGLPVTLQPEEAVAESILQAFIALDGTLKGQRILMPRGAKAREFLPDALREHGADVLEIIVYDTVPAQVSEKEVEALLAFAPEVIAFTSSS